MKLGPAHTASSLCSFLCGYGQKKEKKDPKIYFKVYYPFKFATLPVVRFNMSTHMSDLSVVVLPSVSVAENYPKKSM